MIKYFTNQVLSQKLSTNLAKWKRWSREFLPPDPLGGMQSGYARQYTPDEAFTVYLGGCLVSHLNFSIPDTRQILQDLNPWLLASGFRFDIRNTTDTHEMNGHNSIKHYIIFILTHMAGITGISQNSNRFYYLIRGILSTRSVIKENNRIIEEQYIETHLPSSASLPLSLMDMHPIKVLNITTLMHAFIQNLDLEPLNAKVIL